MNAEFRSAVIFRCSGLVDTASESGRVFTSAGPEEYKGDILEHPELLWTEDQWDEVRVQEANSRIEQQGEKISKYWRNRYEGKADYYWHQFYIRNTDNFYKDRHYLHIVFPELMNGLNSVTTNACTENPSSGQNIGGSSESTEPIHLLEVGCGVGNAILPLLEMNPRLHVTAVDFATSAIEILDQHPLVKQLRAEFETKAHKESASVTHTIGGKPMDIFADMGCRIRTAVRCIVKDELPVPSNSMDLVLCMFVLSAIGPAAQLTALKRCADALRVGGKLLIRDYGRYDEAQLRFKKGSKIDENFYVRQDGTCAYFFTIEQLKEICAQVGLVVEEAEYVLRQYANRQQRRARYRVWVHAKFRKI